MPHLRGEFMTRVPIGKAWQLLSNMERLGLCIPGCKEVTKISNNEYEWVLEAKVLHTSRIIYMRTRATEVVPPTRVLFIGDGKLREGLGFYKMTLSGSMNLQAVSIKETRVIFEGTVSAGGLGGAIINKIASGQMKELLRDFEQSVRNELEK